MQLFACHFVFKASLALLKFGMLQKNGIKDGYKYCKYCNVLNAVYLKAVYYIIPDIAEMWVFFFFLIKCIFILKQFHLFLQFNINIQILCIIGPFCKFSQIFVLISLLVLFTQMS